MVDAVRVDSDNVLALIAEITPGNWPVQIAILADAHAEDGDRDGEDACRDIVAKGRKPRSNSKIGSGKWYWHSNEQLTRADGYISPLMVNEIDRINEDGYTVSIIPQFTGFVEAWRRGFRP